MNDPKIEINQSSTMRLNDTFYEVQICNLVVDLGLALGLHNEMRLRADTPQRPRHANIFSPAVEWGKIDKSDIIFRCLAQVLAMLTVLKA
jgi:hypothetical protein